MLFFFPLSCPALWQQNRNLNTFYAKQICFAKAEAPPNTREGQAPQTATQWASACPSAPGQGPWESRRAHRWVKPRAAGRGNAPPHQEQHKQARRQQVPDPDPGPVVTTYTCTSHTSTHVLPPSTPLGCGATGTPGGQQPPSHHRPRTRRIIHPPGPSRPGQQPGNRGVGNDLDVKPLSENDCPGICNASCRCKNSSSKTSNNISTAFLISPNNLLFILIMDLKLST